jgi:hypothetical protein
MAELLNSDFGFTQADINHLAETLNQRMGADLEDPQNPQRKLLLAIFTAAGDHVSLHNAPIGLAAAAVLPPAAEPASLGEAILNAFIPDANDDLANDYCIQMRITPGVVHPPPPVPPAPAPAPGS